MDELGISRPKSTAGNPEIEAEVFWGVAMPGKQLGKLAEATLALATLVESVDKDVLKKHPDEAKAIQALKDLAQQIERTKEEHKKSAKAEAIKALERLKQADADEYRSYVDGLQQSTNTQRDNPTK